MYLSLLTFLRLKMSWNAMDRMPCTVICMSCLFGNKGLWNSCSFKYNIDRRNPFFEWRGNIFKDKLCLKKLTSLIVNFLTTLEGTYNAQRLARWDDSKWCISKDLEGEYYVWFQMGLMFHHSAGQLKRMCRVHIGTQCLGKE